MADRRIKPSAHQAFLHLFALSGCAVAQPIFDLLGRGAEMLVAHELSPQDVLGLSAILSLGPALLLALVVALVGRLSPALGRFLVDFLVGFFAMLLALLALHDVVPAGGALALAVVVGVLSATAYVHWRGCRGFLSLLALVALLFPLLFLFAPPIRGLLRPAVALTPEVPPIPGQTPVVLVVLDELPLASLLDAGGQIDRQLFPHLAALAEGAHWLRNTNTVSQSTAYAVPAILTGRYPDQSRLSTYSDYPENLFTWLAGAGYRLQVFESHTRLCPELLCGGSAHRLSLHRLTNVVRDLAVVYPHLVLPAAWTARFPDVSSTWRDFAVPGGGHGTGVAKAVTGGEKAKGAALSHARPDNAPELFSAFLASLDGAQPRSLYYVHLMLPHKPWMYLPSGRVYCGGTACAPHGLAANRWVGDDWDLVQTYQRHLLQMVYADRLIGQLVEGLRAAGLYEKALLAVAADHGIGFSLGGPARNLRQHNPAEIIDVPLLVKLPGQEKGSVSDRNVATIDLLPTLAAALDAELPWPVDGISALAEALPERPGKTAYTSGLQGAGEGVALHFPPNLAEPRAEIVERQLGWFGDAPGLGRLFQLGLHDALLGRALTELGPLGEAASGIELELENHLYLDDLKADSLFWPTQIAGRVHTSSQEEPLELAVAVNEVVRATTRTYVSHEGLVEFTAMVPEESLVVGRNRVEIFALQPTASAVPALIPLLERLQQSFALEKVAGGEALTTPDGRSLPVAREHLRGGARVGTQAGQITLSGWAAAAAGQRADGVVLFLDGRFVALAEVGGAPEFGPGTRDARFVRSGFRLELPESLFEGQPEMRLIAFLGDKAKEVRTR